MRSIEHRAPSAPVRNTPRTGLPARYRFALLILDGTACASRVGMLPLEFTCGGGR
jgi:hypothetical protein